MESNTNLRVNFFNIAQLSVPGGRPLTEDSCSVVVSKDYKISRLAFNFDDLLLDESENLTFDIKYSKESKVAFDIINGDRGFPEISIFNSDGNVYRLKRGNFKDFIDRKKLGSWQKVVIPLAVFLPHNDLITSVGSTKYFFDYTIKKVVLDFLKSEENVELNVRSPGICLTENKAIPLDDFIELERIGDTRNFPTLVSENSFIELSLTKNNIGRKFFPSKLVLNVTGKGFETKLEIGNSKSNIRLPLTQYGGNSFSLQTTINDSSYIMNIVVCRTLQKSSEPLKFVGFSDWFGADQARELGTNTFRTVISLKTVKRNGNDFFFPLGRDPFKSLNRSDIDYWISLKELPKWLSRKSEYSDYYRYGTDETFNFKELMRWLFTKAQESGVKVVEMWNEANVIHEWNDSIEALSTLCSLIKDARDEVYPQCKLASPSSTSWDFLYFEKLRANGFFDNIDYLALHGYTYQPENILEYFIKLDKLLDSTKNTKLKVAITEIGFRIPTFSEREQAEFLFLYTIIAYANERVSNIFWFRIQNHRYQSPGGYNQNSSDGYALMGYKNSYVREAYAAYRFLYDILVDKPSAQLDYKGGTIVVSLESKNYIYHIYYNSKHSTGNLSSQSELLLDCFGNILDSSDEKSQKITIMKGKK
ncbi:hypothetical protein ACZ81_17155 [Alteromonas macleodii]|uniref:hypothetical protein n=1 Tax=Alteromonas macleodii TaxID=28108 RepID=UPI000777966E|nr:hypothetical protein [Alteromonas macleodii]AMN13157.1 hypothetical protein ACZ81_17155 [Alteromonas macleodii]MBL3811650.1 hypothetical protein [Alteromonas macleodii]MBL3885188.1 hypothetical protein [Alteromonas macleodii]